MTTIEPKNLKTGDLLLFVGELSWNPKSWVDKLIQIFTFKPYSHIGMILKDPTWIDSKMIGLYLWESSYEGTPDPQDGKVKLGVQITPLENIIKEKKQLIYVRQLYGAEKLTINILEKIHKIVYEKPYDFNPLDWLAAYIRYPLNGSPKTDRYFCSALIACIYTQAGILNKNTNWSLSRPSDFSEQDTHLNWSENCRLEGLFQIV